MECSLQSLNGRHGTSVCWLLLLRKKEAYLAQIITITCFCWLTSPWTLQKPSFLISCLLQKSNALSENYTIGFVSGDVIQKFNVCSDAKSASEVRNKILYENGWHFQTAWYQSRNNSIIKDSIVWEMWIATRLSYTCECGPWMSVNTSIIQFHFIPLGV